MANEKRKQTREEQLEKKRQAERLRYQRMKNDPVKYAKLKEKEKQKYMKRKDKGKIKSIKEMTKRDPVKYAELKEKEKKKYMKKKYKGQIKSIKEMTKREQGEIRQKWRHKTRKHRESLKSKSTRNCPATTPALDIEEHSSGQRNLQNEVIKKDKYEIEEYGYFHDCSRSSISPVSNSYSSIMANKKRKQTREEQLEKKRQAERLRYQRMKNDPIKYAEIRQKWRHRTRKHRESLKLKSTVTPPAPDNDEFIYDEEHSSGQRNLQNEVIKKDKYEIEEYGYFHGCSSSSNSPVPNSYSSIMANEKRKQTREEQLEKKRRAQRLRYQRMRNDPIKYAELKEKEKQKYVKKKDKGQIKSIKEMTKREQGEIRQKWRHKTRKHRESLKLKSTVTTPVSDNEEHSSGQRNLQNEVIKKDKYEIEEYGYFHDCSRSSISPVSNSNSRIMVNKKRKQTREEQLEKKRQAERLRYQRMKNDPIKYAEIRQKWRNKNRKRRESLKSKSTVTTPAPDNDEFIYDEQHTTPALDIEEHSPGQRNLQNEVIKNEKCEIEEYEYFHGYSREKFTLVF